MSSEGPEGRSVLVILGAGASYDCAGASGSVRAEWRPPLARELFAIPQRPNFEEILLPFRGARVLGAELAELSQHSTFGLEAKLREYSRHPDQRIKNHYSDIPRYLGALLQKISYSYTATPATHVNLISGLVAHTQHKLVCVVLNYDTLFEQALALFDATWAITQLFQYIDPKRPVGVYKVHGSVGWYVGMKTNQAWAPGSDFPRYLPPEDMKDIRIATSIDYLDASTCPAITAPVADKFRNDMICPPSHLESLSRALPLCSKVLFIGTSGMDDDVLSLLSEHLPIPELVHYVGVEDIEDVADRIRRQVPKLAHSPSEIQSKGFRSYVNDAAFQRFGRV